MARRMRMMVVLGTRPEAIKLAPLVLAARRSPDIDVSVVNSGQHRQMTAQVLKLFGLEPDVDLDLMRDQQTLTDVTMGVLERLRDVFDANKPDWVVVQGDTTTTFAAALAAFYQKIPVAHVEAGLRTGNMYSPWPEEMNRKLVSSLASLHFPPTEAAAANLRSEAVDASRILVTGNTGIDALKSIASRLVSEPRLREQAMQESVRAGVPSSVEGARPFVLITGHRRESFGPGLESICRAILTLAARFKTHDFVYAVHPNPNVRDTVYARLSAGHDSNIHLVPPLDYLPFVHLIARADLILTDSGGVQEEAPSLGTRVVVLREVTERGEGLKTGIVRLAGTEAERIVACADDALSGRWERPRTSCDVYGDGLASERILRRMLAGLGESGRSL